ncbi:MAG: glycerophosphodiester phosphodiesterase family protein [Elusimicrobiota bacterium]
MSVNSRPRIFAHRGALLNAPENTLAAFRLAFANGADGIECDIRRTKDGELVLFHDPDLRRVAGRPERIADIPYKQFKEIRVFGKEPVAHLNELFALLAEYPGKPCFLDISLDQRRDIEKLARAVVDAGLADRLHILAFIHLRRRLAHARRVCPEVRLSVMPLTPVRLLELARLAGAATVCTGWNQWWIAKKWFRLVAGLTDFRGSVRRAQAAGIEVTGGVANTPDEVRWFADQGVSGVWTDDVPMTRETLDAP